MVNLPYFFYRGDAHYPNVQEAIKDKYHSFLTKSQLFPPPFCSMHPDCTKQRISVFPGEIGNQCFPLGLLKCRSVFYTKGLRLREDMNIYSSVGLLTLCTCSRWNRGCSQQQCYVAITQCRRVRKVSNSLRSYICHRNNKLFSFGHLETPVEEAWFSFNALLQGLMGHPPKGLLGRLSKQHCQKTKIKHILWLLEPSM